MRLLTLALETIMPAKNETLVAFGATLTIALAFAPLRQRVQDLIDRAFYRTKLDYKRLLPELSAQVATNIVLDRLTPLLTKDIPDRLRIAGASLLVVAPDGQSLAFAGNRDEPALPNTHPLEVHLQRSRRPLLYSSEGRTIPSAISDFLAEHAIELSIPLFIGDYLVGVYNLGPKLSDSVYTRDEIQLLTVLGQQAAVSVENARLYREVENHSRTLEAQIQQRTAELERAMLEAQDARFAAEAATQAKSAFLANMSHRPAGAAIQDQARVATPVEAMAAGADWLVIGRPINAASDPAAALAAILDGLQGDGK